MVRLSCGKGTVVVGDYLSFFTYKYRQEYFLVKNLDSFCAKQQKIIVSGK